MQDYSPKLLPINGEAAVAPPPGGVLSAAHRRWSRVLDHRPNRREPKDMPNHKGPSSHTPFFFSPQEGGDNGIQGPKMHHLLFWAIFFKFFPADNNNRTVSQKKTRKILKNQIFSKFLVSQNPPKILPKSS